MVSEPIRTDGGPILDSASVTVEGDALLVCVGWRGLVHVVGLRAWPAVREVTAGSADFSADLSCVAAVSPRSGTAVAVIGDVSGTLHVLRLRDLAWLRSVDRAGGAVLCVAATELPDGGILVATGHADGTVRSWSVSEDGSLEPAGPAIEGMAGGVLCLAVTAGGGVTVAYSGAEPVVRLADLLTGTAAGPPMPVPSRPHKLAWQAAPRPALVVGGRYIAVVEPDRVVPS